MDCPLIEVTTELTLVKEQIRIIYTWERKGITRKRQKSKGLEMEVREISLSINAW